MRNIGDLTLVKVCLLLRLKYYAFGNYLKIETIENIPVTYMGKPIMDHISDTKYPPPSQLSPEAHILIWLF